MSKLSVCKSEFTWMFITGRASEYCLNCLCLIQQLSLSEAVFVSWSRALLLRQPPPASRGAPHGGPKNGSHLKVQSQLRFSRRSWRSEVLEVAIVNNYGLYKIQPECCGIRCFHAKRDATRAHQYVARGVSAFPAVLSATSRGCRE